MLFGHRALLTYSGCNIGRNLCAISTNGEIYPCQAFIGDEKYNLGNIKQGIINKELFNEVADYGFDDANSCSQCPIKYMCSDLCTYNFFTNGGKEHKPNQYRCDIYKAFLKSSFYLYYELKSLPVQSMKLKIYYSQFLERPW